MQLVTLKKQKQINNGSVYFKVLTSSPVAIAVWQRGPVAAKQILIYFNCGSLAAWPRGSKYTNFEFEKKYKKMK